MNKTEKSPSMIARMLRTITGGPRFKLRKSALHGGRMIWDGGTLIRNPRKVRKLAVQFEGRTIILTGKSLRRHRIKMKRIEREAAKAKA